ncbi:hypothetical protein ACHAXR_009364, partial [Thalassiosira sp. AJA248-18]
MSNRPQKKTPLDRASFLHEDSEIDTSASSSLAVPRATSATDDSVTANSIDVSSAHRHGAATATAAGELADIKDGRITVDNSSCSYESSYNEDDTSISELFGFGSVHVPSITTIGASHSSRSGVTPHELAALVAMRVKSTFANTLPASLRPGEDDDGDGDYSSDTKSDKLDCIAPYKTGEIILGPLLGSGEFSHVYEIKAFRPDTAVEATLTAEEIDTRRHMKQRERYHDTKRACYAVKHLRPQLLEKYDPLEYAQTASDLALEAEFLANLSHPNIIKLRGISFAGAKGFENGPKGYFLIIDRLNETLDMRLKRWKKEKKKKKVMGSGMIGSGLKKTMLLAERISVSSGTTSEEGRHSTSVRGDVKLFDFGLATIMPSNGDPYEDKFEMSGAGSPRYMAPEVLVNPPDKYNLKADVYTFGIVLWEIFSLEVPYSHVKGKDELVEFVAEQDGRPTINENWPEPIKEVLHQSFDPDIAQRPSIELFYNMLRFHLLNLRDGDDTKLDNAFINRRRSHGSMKKHNGNVDYGQQQRGHHASREKFPQRVKNTIRSHVKLPPASSSSFNGEDHAAQPKRMRNKLRDKFHRLSS